MNLVNCQILVNGVRPGSWNAIVPIHGVSYAAAMALIIDAADGQGWLRDLVQRLVDEYPTRPEFASVLAEVDRGASDGTLVRQLGLLAGYPHRRLAIMAGLVAVVLAVAGISLWKYIAETRRSIAVLGFRNQAGKEDAAWLSTALAELYNAEFSAGRTLRVIPSENVARMKIELRLAETDNLARDSLQKIRASLGADLILVGTYLVAAGDIQVSMQLRDTVTGDTLFSITENGTQEGLKALISRTGAELRAKMGAAGAAIPPSTLAGTLPSNPKATGFYTTGLDKLRMFDALGARDLFEQAVNIEPGHALAHSALAAAWASLGYDDKARTEAKKAFDLSENLPSEKRRLVEARYREAASEWDKAIEVYRTLRSSAPDDVEYGLALARVNVDGGFADEAFGVVDDLRNLPHPACDDPRIDLAESSAAYALGDLQRARDAAVRGSLKARRAGARLLLAGARLQESQARLQLRELQEATKAIDEAEKIYASTRNRGGLSDALANRAVLRHYQGNLSGARDLYEESLAIKLQIGDTGGAAKLRNNIAAVDWERGDLDGAKSMFEKSLALHRDVGDQSGVGSVLNNIAAIVLAQGDLTKAKATYRESQKIAHQTRDKSAIALASYNIAAVEQEEGNLDEALRLLQNALAMERANGADKSAIADSLVSIAGIFRKQGKPKDAQSQLREALALYTEDQGTEGIFVARLALADLARDDRRSAASESLARECSDYFRKARSDREAEARAVLADSFLDQRKLAEAKQEIELAERLAARSQDVSVRTSVGITAARIRAASGRPADVSRAQKALQASLDTATKNGWVARQLELRLALGEVELKVNGAAGRSRLTALELDATASGFLLVARRASELRRAAT